MEAKIFPNLESKHELPGITSHISIAGIFNDVKDLAKAAVEKTVEVAEKVVEVVVPKKAETPKVEKKATPPSPAPKVEEKKTEPVVEKKTEEVKE